MKSKEFSFLNSIGMSIFTRKWEPDLSPFKGIVLIIHGISEHSGRYAAFAEALTNTGYIVYAHDQRGHGKTTENQETQGYAGGDGWNLLVRDVQELIELAKKENPGLPLFILGHSMGSFILRHYMHQYKDSQGVKGFILSGTGGSSKIMLAMARFLCAIVIKKNGKMDKSKLIQELTFKDFNARCVENRNGFDWLSRDIKEVDKYVEDDLCGQVCTVSFYNDFFGGIMEVQKKSNINNISKDIPILIFSGQMDPVGHYGKMTTSLVQSYKAVGIQDITYKLYENARHEMLNEINRDEVIQDIIRWMNLKV